MSRLPAALAIICLALAPRPAAGELIHRWSFDEARGPTVFDSVGRADGKIVSLASEAGGGVHERQPGRVRLFGGRREASDHIELPGGLLEGLDEFTLEIWATPHGFPSWGTLFSFGSDGNDSSLTMWLSRGDNGSLQRLAVEPSIDLDTDLGTVAGRRYHSTVVWRSIGPDRSRLEWYRDALPVASQDLGSRNPGDLVDEVLWLGRSHDESNRTADVSFFEVRLWDHALTEDEISRSAVLGPDGAGSGGLAHRFRFDDFSGERLEDSVGGAQGRIVVRPGGGAHTLGGGAVRLDGGDPGDADFVELPGRLLGSELSIELWCTPLAFLDWGHAFSLGSGSGAARALSLSLSRGTNGNEQRLDLAGRVTIDTALETVPGRRSHHVVVLDDDNFRGRGGRLAWYRDGALVGERPITAQDFRSIDDAVLWLGRSQSSAHDVASASFSELRLWGRALAPAEIRRHATLGPDEVDEVTPIASNDQIVLQPGRAAHVDVLANDFGSGLTTSSVDIVEPPTAGTVGVSREGHVVYRHSGGPGGVDGFSYRVTDASGRVSAPAHVSVTISPAIRIDNATLRLPDTPPPAALAAVDAFPGLRFEDPVAATSPPGDRHRLFVVERRLGVSVIPDVTAPHREVFLDLSTTLRTTFNEEGILGLAFHPEFAVNGHFFVYYVLNVAGLRTNRLARFTVSPTDPERADRASELPLFDLRDQENNHNAGDLHFGPDGYLYVSMGDEGTQRDRLDNSQRIDRDLYSGILRIDVDRRPGSLEPNPHPAIALEGGVARYAIPPDNPWIGATEFNGLAVDPARVRTEFWAVGLRHPWRMSFDPLTGDLRAGDVGQSTWEEVNLIVRGGNYGWVHREGFHAGPVGPRGGSTFTRSAAIEPLVEHRHNDRTSPDLSGNSVIGGRVYRGLQIPELSGKYVYGDYVSGNIWSLEPVSGTVERILGENDICAFAEDPSNGDLLLLDFIEDRIKRIVRQTEVASFPERLSETGVFAELAALAPNPGVNAYEPRVAFWSDRAVKRRWFVMPDGEAAMGFSRDGSFDFPAGMTWIKHFELGAVRVETRLLRRTADGFWGVSYRWDESGHDATLVGESGATIDFVVDGATQTWRIPSRAECAACHGESSGVALSFDTRQLNRPGRLGAHDGNLLELLAEGEYFDQPLPAAAALPAHARLDDPTASLESRVRSYLAVNCSPCHRPGGSGPSTWSALPEISLEETGLIGGRATRDTGDPLDRLVVPGDPEHSVLLRRLDGSGGLTRMPPLASNVVDHGAIALVTAWIESLGPSVPGFVRGDANGDGRVDLSDAARVLAFLFRGGELDCQAAGDSNDDGAVRIDDAISLLTHLFVAGPPPAEPYPECGGVSEGADCAEPRACRL